MRCGVKKNTKMLKKRLIKTILALTVFSILAAVNVKTILGNAHYEEGAIKPKTRSSAPLQERKNPKTANLIIKSFKVEPNEPDSFFLKNKEISAVCVVANTSSKTIRDFRALVRTPVKNIAVVENKELAPGETFELTGSFEPAAAGFLPVACRADIDNDIDEINENDNVELRNLYVLLPEQEVR